MSLAVVSPSRSPLVPTVTASTSTSTSTSSSTTPTPLTTNQDPILHTGEEVDTGLDMDLDTIPEQKDEEAVNPPQNQRRTSSPLSSPASADRGNISLPPPPITHPHSRSRSPSYTSIPANQGGSSHNGQALGLDLPDQADDDDDEGDGMNRSPATSSTLPLTDEEDSPRGQDRELGDDESDLTEEDEDDEEEERVEQGPRYGQEANLGVRLPQSRPEPHGQAKEDSQSGSDSGDDGSEDEIHRDAVGQNVESGVDIDMDVDADTAEQGDMSDITGHREQLETPLTPTSRSRPNRSHSHASTASLTPPPSDPMPVSPLPPSPESKPYPRLRLMAPAIVRPEAKPKKILREGPRSLAGWKVVIPRAEEETDDTEEEEQEGDNAEYDSDGAGDGDVTMRADVSHDVARDQNDSSDEDEDDKGETDAGEDESERKAMAVNSRLEEGEGEEDNVDAKVEETLGGATGSPKAQDRQSTSDSKADVNANAAAEAEADDEDDVKDDADAAPGTRTEPEVEVDMDANEEDEDEGEGEEEGDNEAEADAEDEGEVDNEAEQEPAEEDAEDVEPETADSPAYLTVPSHGKHSHSHSSHAPPPSQGSMRQLVMLELKFAALRDRLYIERMEEAAAEEDMILNGTHPALQYLYKTLSDRRERLHEVASRRHQQTLAELKRVREAEKHLVWSSWTDERDRLHWEEFEQTWSKRRRLAREKNEIETPRIVKPIPKVGLTNLARAFDWSAGASPTQLSREDGHNDLALMESHRPYQTSRHASPAVFNQQYNVAGPSQSANAPVNAGSTIYSYPQESAQQSHPLSQSQSQSQTTTHHSHVFAPTRVSHTPASTAASNSGAVANNAGPTVRAPVQRREGRTVPTTSDMFNGGPRRDRERDREPLPSRSKSSSQSSITGKMKSPPQDDGASLAASGPGFGQSSGQGQGPGSSILGLWGRTVHDKLPNGNGFSSPAGSASTIAPDRKDDSPIGAPGQGDGTPGSVQAPTTTLPAARAGAGANASGTTSAGLSNSSNVVPANGGAPSSSSGFPSLEARLSENAGRVGPEAMRPSSSSSTSAAPPRPSSQLPTSTSTSAPNSSAGAGANANAKPSSQPGHEKGSNRFNSLADYLNHGGPTPGGFFGMGMGMGVGMGMGMGLGVGMGVGAGGSGNGAGSGNGGKTSSSSPNKTGATVGGRSPFGNSFAHGHTNGSASPANTTGTGPGPGNPNSTSMSNMNPSPKAPTPPMPHSHTPANLIPAAATAGTGEARV